MDWSMAFSLIGVILILVLMFWGSKWLTKKYSSSSGSKHIKITDRVMLGKDKYIVLADICDSKYIIGVTGQQITLLKDIGEIDLPEGTSDLPADFTTIFNDMLKKQMVQVKDKFKNIGKKP